MKKSLMTGLLLTAFTGCNGQDIKVEALYPDLLLSVESVDFASQKVDESTEQTIQLVNAGRARLNISEMEVVGDAVFSVGEFPAVLAIDEVAELSIGFLPVDLESYEAELVIYSDDEDEPELRLPLLGEGGLGPLPDIALSEDTLDFGQVFPGSEKLLFVNVENQGADDLLISQSIQTGSGAFVLMTDIDGRSLAPNSSTSILVNYVPTQENGDEGQLTIRSNDPDEGEVVLSLIGNGGGGFDYPVAVLECPADVSIGSTVTINGSSSSDPSGESLLYHWSLIEKPIGSAAEVNATTGSTFLSLPVDLAGRYKVGLVVENESAVPSAQAECVWSVEPPADVYAELSWGDTEADFDLHMTTDPEGLFTFESDCCWCNSEPSWSGRDVENPVLVNDSEDGTQAEVILLDTASLGEYYFRVHYFSDNGAGPADATIRIYINGVLHGQYTETMTHNDLWSVGFVRWPNQVLAEELESPTAWENSRTCH